MRKDELMKLVGKQVNITLRDGDVVSGILGYTYGFSKAYNFTKTNYFHVDDVSFKVTHVKKVEVKE